MKFKLLLFSIVFVFSTIVVFPQNQTISGKVSNANSKNIIHDARVNVKGTSFSTYTDQNGEYAIQVPSDSMVLQYSFKGMRTIEIQVQKQSIIDVALIPDTAKSSNVLNSSLVRHINEKLPLSMAELSSNDFEYFTQPGLQSALQGKVAGIYVNGGSGKLAQAINVSIRGTSSVFGNNQPLYVLDGQPIVDQTINAVDNEPLNFLANINPADIESVQILKDGSAAAIYGSRASNGAVVITTKRGKNGKTYFNFTSQVGFSEPTNKIRFLNRKQYLSLFEESFNNRVTAEGSVWGAYTNFENLLDDVFPFWRDADDPANLSKGPDTDWENQVFRRGFIQQYNLSTSQGAEKYKLYTSLSLANQESMLINNDFERLTGRVNFDFKPSDIITIGVNINPSRVRSLRIPKDDSPKSLLRIVALPPLDPKYIPRTKNLNNQTIYENPLIPNNQSNSKAEFISFIHSLYAHLNLSRNFFFKTEFGVDNINYNERLASNPSEKHLSKTATINSNNYLSFEKDIAEKFNLSLIGGLSYFNSNTDVTYSSATSGGEYDDKNNLLSYYLFSTFSVNKRYIFNLNGRYEKSSRLSEDNRYKFFPFLSAAWVITSEEFLNNQQFLSFLKINAILGLTGSDQYGYNQNYLISSKLNWQITKQTDFRIDFGFLDNRITGEIDYYIKKTSDLFLNVSLPSTNGYEYITKNAGNMDNNGWEFVITTNNLTGALQWNTSFNISSNKNRITNLDGLTISNGIWRAMEGYPIGVFYMKKFVGVDPDNGDALFYTDATRTTTTSNISAAAPQVVGDPNPDFVGGINNTFKYKGFDLDLFFQFVYGNDIFNGGRQWQADGLSYFDNQSLDVYKNRWTTPGQKTSQPQSRFDIGNGYGISSMLVFDGSYIRLKDITLGYSLPSKLITRLRLNNLRVFVKGLNLLTKTNYPGWDPESSLTGTGSSDQYLQQGYDFYTSPQPKTITFGIHIGF